MPYLESEDLQKLNSTNLEKVYGFCLIFDIIGSTALKLQRTDSWKDRFRAFYRAFENLVAEMKTQLHLAEEPIKKFIGDAAMAFFVLGKPSKDNGTTDQDRSIKFLMLVRGFLNELEDQSETTDIKVKTVATYLTDVHRVTISPSTTDVLGRGIDFSFRLEKYSDSSYITINDELFKLNDRETFITALALHPLQCEKTFKGWDKPEKFHLLVDRTWLVATVQGKKPSNDAENVYLELFQWYTKSSEELGPKPELSKLLDPKGGPE